jgi:GT2 family glycosyltransferase
MSESRSGALVCAIVLNYNGRAHLEYALPSLAQTAHRPFSLMIVDNASTDDSVEYVQHAFPSATLVVSDSNRGWSGGNNLGIAHAQQLNAAYVVLANNDIRVHPRWLDAPVALAEHDERIGIIGFHIIEAGGVRSNTEAFERAIAEWSTLETTESKPVDGMAMFVRMSLFDHLGFIDEGFFAYAEDNDLERRARRAGYRVITTNIPVRHHGGGTFDKKPLWAARLQIRNNLRLSLKHESLAGFLYQLLRHFAKGCLPFLHVDRNDRIARRLRPSNILVNFALFVYAVMWNLLHLPHTLRQRRADTRRIEATRHELDRI